MLPQEPFLIMEMARLKDEKRQIAFKIAEAQKKIISDLANFKALAELFKLQETFSLAKWDGKELPPKMTKIAKLACFLTDYFYGERMKNISKEGYSPEEIKKRAEILEKIDKDESLLEKVEEYPEEIFELEE